MFRKKTNNHIVSNNDERRYKRFEETFPFCTLGLVMSFIYPNAATKKGRIITYALCWLVMVPGIVLINLDLVRCMEVKEMENLNAHIVIALVFTVYGFKTFTILYYETKFRNILDFITKDYLKANDMAEDYQEIYDEYIGVGKLGQKCLFIISIICATLFPGYSGAATAASYMFDEVPHKTMVHPILIHNYEVKQFENPFYVLFWLYQLIPCIVMSPSFAGFDASFGICCAHLSLKLRLAAHKLKRIFEDAKDLDELKAQLKEAVAEHQDALNFYDIIQDMYGDWLFVVYLLSSSIISLNLYQISARKGINPKYGIFSASAIVHLGIPCHFASVLYKASNDMPSEIYKCEWEKWNNPKITKMVMFMIARAQQPLALKARGLVTYNMELFVSVLQASYSFYTLIRS